MVDETVKGGKSNRTEVAPDGEAELIAPMPPPVLPVLPTTLNATQAEALSQFLIAASATNRKKGFFFLPLTLKSQIAMRAASAT
jgi:hypothetical protein